MKEYHHKKDSKDSRFLAVFRKSFNKDRLANGFTIEEAAHDLGMSRSTYDAKMKPSNNENDISVTDWNHHLELSADFSTLEYFASKHGFELKKLDVLTTCKNTDEISLQADRAMMEANEAWKELKIAISDNSLSKKEIYKVTQEVDEAIAALQQLKHDVNCKLEEIDDD